MPKACSKCEKIVNIRDLHHINYSDEYICNECYTEDIRKEEDYYDYCIAHEYSYDSKDGKESRRINYSDSKFYN